MQSREDVASERILNTHHVCLPFNILFLCDSVETHMGIVQVKHDRILQGSLGLTPDIGRFVMGNKPRQANKPV